MIPRLKPKLGFQEILAASHPTMKDDVECFEKCFARLMGQKYALAFPYGRTGLIFLLQAMEVKGKEIICPAYTCVVVPHAIAYSGNKPVFVDCAPGEFNMDLVQTESAITENTGAIIATSLFGYPINLDKLDALGAKYPYIPIIQDCAHSFAAQWNRRPVQKQGLAAIYGLNISKILTSVFGGIITTDNKEIYSKLKLLRNHKLTPSDRKKKLRRFLYLITVYPTFWHPLYSLVNYLERSKIINYFVQYYDESKIDMPFDYTKAMSCIEARVGIANINRYQEIIAQRYAAAMYYFNNLPNSKDFKLPPRVNGATYSHFVVQVPDRKIWLKKGIKAGVQLGWLIEYSIPEMHAYGGHKPEDFPFSGKLARTALNLPMWGGIRIAKKVVNFINKVR